MSNPANKFDYEISHAEVVTPNDMDSWWFDLNAGDVVSLADLRNHALVAGEGRFSSVGHGADGIPDVDDADVPIMAVKIFNTSTDPDAEPIYIGGAKRQEYPIYPHQAESFAFSNLRNIWIRAEEEVRLRIWVLLKDI